MPGARSRGPSSIRIRGSARSSQSDGAEHVIVLDGEAVLLGVDGRSDFNGLHSRRHDAEVTFYAFDILGGDGEECAPCFRRRSPDGISANLARPTRW